MMNPRRAHMQPRRSGPNTVITIHAVPTRNNANHAAEAAWKQRQNNVPEGP